MQMTVWRVLAVLAASCVVLLASTPSRAAEAPPAEAAADETRYPSLDILGFADAGFSVTDADSATSNSGFFLGQLVLHFTSPLSSRIAFFGEVSVTTGGASYGAAHSGDTYASSGTNADLHRSVLKYTHSDHLKLSIGRFHTPIGYWNVAFHHGQWLQTSVTRPRWLDFSNPFLPLHFIGAMAEGGIPSKGVNLAWLAGVGNGSGGGPGRPDQPGDINDHRAWIVRLSAKPEWVKGLQVGGSWYEDKVQAYYGPTRAEFRERIAAAYAVLTGETPELLAEYAAVRHRRLGRPDTFESRAWYVQAAWRISTRLKPYVRWEEIELDGEDHLVEGAAAGRTGLAGVRLDLADFVAVKAEYQRRDRGAGPFRNGLLAQASFTF
jgi:hypothetical protein